MSSVSDLPGSENFRLTRVLASPDEATTPQNVVVLKIRRREQVRAGILGEYFRAAERGSISFLRYYRLSRGMDQMELARRTGLTQSAIARAEKTGQLEKMKGFTLKKLASALGLKVDDLLR